MKQQETAQRNRRRLQPVVSALWLAYLAVVVFGGAWLMEWFRINHFYLWALTYPLQIALLVAIPFLTLWLISKIVEH